MIYSVIRMSISIRNVIIRMNSVQCRMARTALQITTIELATLSKVAPSTVARLEAGERLQPRTVEAIRSALEKAGVEFLAEDDGGPGVRLKKSRSKRAKS
jgi:transcriptional regulator with XRE-family HTH domain